MADEINIQYDDFLRAVERRVASGSRDLHAVMVEQLRGVYRSIIDISPPAHGGVTGKAAELKGKAIVAADIRKIYGTPGDAYKKIAETSRVQAAVFWSHRKKRQPAEAAKIVKYVTGLGIYKFDGGALHQRLQNARGRVVGRAAFNGAAGFYVERGKDVEDYIKDVQSRVGWLAGGWREIAVKLGLPLAAFIARQPSPSVATVHLADALISVRASNEISWASAGGFDRRVQWAVDRQTRKLENAFQNYNDRLWRQSGFRVAP